MEDRTCPKCHQTFALPCRLKAHLGRKKTCDPSSAHDMIGVKHPCKHCGRVFASKTGMYRHVRLNCKVAVVGEERRAEVTVHQQLADQAEQLAELTAMMRDLAAPQPAAGRPVAAPTINTGPVTVTHNTQVVNIHPWDGNDRISVPVGLIVAAFAENPRLVEYGRMSDQEKADPKMAAPYVLEALLDLTRRAHADPQARNVYLSPRRADQTMVQMKDGRWEVCPLADATRLIFDGVATGIRRATRADLGRNQLPFSVQASAPYVPIMYEDTADEYVRRAKAPMAAHLQNTAPAPASALVALAQARPATSAEDDGGPSDARASAINKSQ